MAAAKKRRPTPLQIAVHVAGWVPLIVLVWDFYAGNLTVNPIQEIEQRLGRTALNFLVLALACTPLNTIFGWRELLKRRRALGLYTFMYASLHLFVFAVIDYGLDWQALNEATLEKPYALMGLTAFLILLPLAITSFQWWMKKLGPAWKSLHRLVYPAGVIVIIHYAWAKKGSLATLSGDILRPLIFGLIIAFLLTLRIPPIRKAASQFRQRLKLRRSQTPKSPPSMVEKDMTRS